MRVFNVEKTTELTEYDLNLGHLENDVLTTHVSAVEPVEEIGHYETIKEYPNGGKDVKWVVDVPKTEGVEEHDETEEILIYVPYTENEMKVIALKEERNQLEDWLKDHDYIGTKIATGRATAEEYATAIEEMTVKANRINEIDEELKKGL